MKEGWKKVERSSKETQKKLERWLKEVNKEFKRRIKEVFSFSIPKKDLRWKWSFFSKKEGFEKKDGWKKEIKLPCTIQGIQNM